MSSSVKGSCVENTKKQIRHRKLRDLIEHRRQIGMETAVASFRGNRMIRIENAHLIGVERRLRARCRIERGTCIFTARGGLSQNNGNALVTAPNEKILCAIVGRDFPQLVDAMYCPEHEHDFSIIRQFSQSQLTLESMDGNQLRTMEKVYRSHVRCELHDHERSFFATCAFLVIANHSCWPNVQVVYELRAEETTQCGEFGVNMIKINILLHFYATRAIEKDEELCVNYLAIGNTYLPTKRRRACLQTLHQFECMCQRCVDGTRFRNDAVMIQAAPGFRVSSPDGSVRFADTKRHFEMIEQLKRQSTRMIVRVIALYNLASTFLDREQSVLGPFHWRIYRVLNCAASCAYLLEKYDEAREYVYRQMHLLLQIESYDEYSAHKKWLYKRYLMLCQRVHESESSREEATDIQIDMPDKYGLLEHFAAVDAAFSIH